jgi:DNA-binding protein H-NS
MPMATSKELQAQVVALQKQIAETRRQEIATAVEQVRALIREHGLSVDDIGKRVFAKGGAAGQAAGKTVNPPKYQDPKSGATWTGVGRAPSWLAAAVKAGREADFLIGASATRTKSKAPAKKAPAKKAAAKKTKKTRQVG